MNLILRNFTLFMLLTASLGCTGSNNGNSALPEAQPPNDVFKRQVGSMLNDIESMVDSNGIQAFASAADSMGEGLAGIDRPSGGANAAEIDAIMSDLEKLLTRADTYSKKEVYDEIDAIKKRVDSL